MKIHIKFSNGDVFEVDAHIVADDRAKYYAKLDVDRGDKTNYTQAYQEELQHGLSDDYELTDWMSNNMNWEDIEPYATRLPRKDNFGYSAAFTNADKEVTRSEESQEE